MVELTAALLIRVGSGLLWLALGLGVLALAREARGRLLGLVAASFGAHFVLFNLTAFDPATQMIAVTASPLLFAVFGTAAIALAWRLAPLGRERSLVVVLALVAIVAALARLSVYSRNLTLNPEAAAVYRYTDCLFVFGNCALGGLAFTLAGVHRRSAARGATLVALALGSYASFVGGSGVAGIFGRSDTDAWAYWGAPLAVTLAASVAWLVATNGPESGRARNVAIALVAAAAAGALTRALANETDAGNISIGVVRSVGAALFAAAIFRDRFLDLPLPSLVARRGTLAAAALAILFIVAQIAQNYLSAEYGLLTGGVIAGAFLFAAQPLQRAMERITDSRAPAPPEPGSASAIDRARREEMYGKALRIALHDRVVSRDEELHLFQLAEEIGIGAGRAMELRHEIERERKGPR